MVRYSGWRRALGALPIARLVMNAQSPSQRFVIWVDAVGGFLVCARRRGDVWPGDCRRIGRCAAGGRHRAASRDDSPRRGGICPRSERRNLARRAASWNRRLRWPTPPRCALARWPCGFAGRTRYRPRRGSNWPAGTACGRRATRCCCWPSRACWEQNRPATSSAPIGSRRWCCFTRPASSTAASPDEFEIDGRSHTDCGPLGPQFPGRGRRFFVLVGTGLTGFSGLVRGPLGCRSRLSSRQRSDILDVIQLEAVRRGGLSRAVAMSTFLRDHRLS